MIIFMVLIVMAIEISFYLKQFCHNYTFLFTEYQEVPPPPYSSLSLLPLPTQEMGPHVSNRTEDSSRIVHI